ncbi:hypothetical protein niasHT_021172 [Heterodera trifolii]|uniref:Cyclin-like domain-containing protein n=2 Tax=Heterodera trifolii TaxID=157864 RepID=A0ABD2JFJ5_9BILA
MAGNFWKSSHFEQWILDKGDLLRERGEDLKVYSEEEYQKLMIFFTNFIQEMGQCKERELGTQCNENTRDRPIQRMQAIATACVYFRRFYARRSFKDIDPFLLSMTCTNLASKVEEMGHLTHTKLTATFQRAMKKWALFDPQQMALYHQIKHHHISETEFCLVELLDCSLIVYHPYRPLLQFRNDMKNASVQNAEHLYQDAWRVCNDSLKSDVALLYPPHMVAIAAIMVAALMRGGYEKDKELKNWLAELNVDYEKILEIQQMLFSMYSVWRTFDEQTQLKGLLEKIPRPNQINQTAHNVHIQ